MKENIHNPSQGLSLNLINPSNIKRDLLGGVEVPGLDAVITTGYVVSIVVLVLGVIYGVYKVRRSGGGG